MVTIFQKRKCRVSSVVFTCSLNGFETAGSDVLFADTFPKMDAVDFVKDLYTSANEKVLQYQRVITSIRYLLS